MVQELKRLPGWRGRLFAEMEARRHAGFVWGESDCAVGLASSAVHAITGVDLAAEWRGQYSTAAGALRALREAGHETLAEAAASLLPEIHPSAANIGDVAVVPSDGEIGAFGVFDTGTIVVMTLNGIDRLPRAAAIRAFKVG